MGKRGVVLEEKLWIDECFLFQDETLAPIFCKSKLIPLKTITMRKLEQMQRELMEKLIPPEVPKGERSATSDEAEAEASTSDAKGSADVWTADG